MSAIPKSTLGVSAFTRANDSFARSESLATSDFWERNAASEPSWQSAIDELLRIRNLNDDWDGEETKAPPPANGCFDVCAWKHSARTRFRSFPQTPSSREFKGAIRIRTALVSTGRRVSTMRPKCWRQSLPNVGTNTELLASRCLGSGRWGYPWKANRTIELEVMS